MMMVMKIEHECRRGTVYGDQWHRKWVMERILGGGLKIIYTFMFEDSIMKSTKHEQRKGTIIEG
jgi:hypothetical protein